MTHKIKARLCRFKLKILSEPTNDFIFIPLVFLHRPALKLPQVDKTVKSRFSMEHKISV